MNVFLRLSLAVSLISTAGCFKLSQVEVKNESLESISGTATLGPVKNGQIIAKRIDGNGRPGRILGQTTTDAAGNFQLQIPNQTDPFQIEILSGTYLDEATNTNKAISNSSESLKMVLPDSASATAYKATGLAITTLTTAEAELAKNMQKIAGSSSSSDLKQKIKNANKLIKESFGCDPKVAAGNIYTDSIDVNSDKGKNTALQAGLSVLTNKMGISHQKWAKMMAMDLVDGQADGKLNDSKLTFKDSVGNAIALADETTHPIEQVKQALNTFTQLEHAASVSNSHLFNDITQGMTATPDTTGIDISVSTDDSGTKGLIEEFENENSDLAIPETFSGISANDAIDLTTTEDIGSTTPLNVAPIIISQAYSSDPSKLPSSGGLKIWLKNTTDSALSVNLTQRCMIEDTRDGSIFLDYANSGTTGTISLAAGEEANFANFNNGASGLEADVIYKYECKIVWVDGSYPPYFYAGEMGYTTANEPPAKIVIIDPIDGTVDSPIVVTVEVRDQFNNLVQDYNGEVAILSTGSATGVGVIAITNGIGMINIANTVKENVTLSLTDTGATGLDISSTQDIFFSHGVPMRFIILDPVDVDANATVDIVVQVLDQFDNLVTSFQDDVTLAATGDALPAGNGVIDIVNGEGIISLTNATAETVMLTLVDDFATSLNVDTMQDIIFMGTAAPVLTYAASSMTEATANDGSISDAIDIILSDDTFTGVNGDDFIASAKATITNLPAGLTGVLTRTSATTLTLTLNGNASNHSNLDDISNLSLQFHDLAFTAGNAANVINNWKTDISLDFADPAPIAGFTISQSASTLSENGGTAMITIVLDAQPTADVSLQISSSDLSEATISTASLIFTTVNWNTPQTITVSGLDDATVDGDQAITIMLSAASSSDINYNGLDPMDQNFTVLDDDVAANPALTFASMTFMESTQNDGSIDGAIDIILSDDTFAGLNGDDLITSGAAMVMNLPMGLTANLIRTSDTMLALSLTGNATNHSNADDLSNLTLQFQDTAFTNSYATQVVNFIKQDLFIDFNDPMGPQITSVTLPTNANYVSSQDLDFIVNYDATVTVMGSPRLALTIGSTTVYAMYMAGSGTTAITFRYMTADGDFDSDGITLATTLDLNGATLVDASSIDADIDFSDLSALNTSGILINNITATKFVMMDPADGTVDSPIGLEIMVQDDLGNIVQSYNGQVTLASDSGTITGTGLVDIVNGFGVVYISNTVSETVTLSLTDTQGTSLDVTSTQDVVFTNGVASAFTLQDPVDTSVNSSEMVFVMATDQFGNLCLDYTGEVTLVTDGNATGSGVVSIVNGMGSLSITNTVSETINLTLSDHASTGLDVTSTQDMFFQ